MHLQIVRLSTAPEFIYRISRKLQAKYYVVLITTDAFYLDWDITYEPYGAVQS